MPRPSQSGFDGALFSTTLLGDLTPYLGAEENSELVGYQYDAAGYIRDKLGWSPWSGGADTPGQVEVIRAYELALKQQHEKDAWENGEKTEDQLTAWRPGQPIKNRIRVEAGHTVGKTKLFSGLVNHFFDCFTPSIIYTFAPSWEQIHDLLWKEIKTDRRDKGLPGDVLDIELRCTDNHFAKGRATNNAGGTGTERAQGQHGKYLMFVLDEAEGIADFVWSAIDSMASGGIVIVLMAANPRTRSSKFHKAATLSTVHSFRISCVNHPNVREGREVVPGAVRREYVAQMIEKHCETVKVHSPDDYTFTLPFAVQIGAQSHQPGTIFRPNAEFLFRVQGIAPANIADNTLIPVGRFEAATARRPRGGDRRVVRMGVDVARWGADFGTLYVAFEDWVRRKAQFWQQDTLEYFHAIKAEALTYRASDVGGLHIRVDGGGGFGGGLIDLLVADLDLRNAFPDFRVQEVHFNGTPLDEAAFADLITELHAQAAETLKGVAVLDAPEALEADLCERTFEWVNREGVSVKKLTPKEKFKKEHGRSPDDGDGFVLAAAPIHFFGGMGEVSAVRRQAPRRRVNW